MSIEVIFEDQQLLVINKPAGWVVNRAESVRDKTIQDWVEAYLGWSEGRGDYSGTTNKSDSNMDENRVFQQRSGVAHRLDKDTSGILVIAKDPKSLGNILSQFKSRQVHKVYLAVVHGRVVPLDGCWVLPIQRSTRNRHKFVVGVDGKIAETGYRVKSYYTLNCKVNKYRDSEKMFSELELFPKTGRTHQLRVHLKQMRHPIVADKLYLGKREYQRDRIWCERHFLHAWRIEFQHPKLGNIVQFEAKLPQDLIRAKEHLAEL